MTPYFDDGQVTLYLGDCREIVPAASIAGDLVLTDPPYAATSLEWDRWPEGWATVAAQVAPAMWCFGSLRMFMDRVADFSAWQISQDIVWEKHNGSSFLNDRFRRIHEQAVFFYQGPWEAVPKHPVFVNEATARTVVRRKTKVAHLNNSKHATAYESFDGGPKLQTSIIYAASMHGKAIHPTEKPVALIDPLIRYGCAEGGTVVDLFAGSGSTLDAARRCGRRAIGIEANEEYAERAARRLSQQELFA